MPQLKFDLDGRWGLHGWDSVALLISDRRLTTYLWELFYATALFSSEKISDFANVALSFLFDKYCPIMY